MLGVYIYLKLRLASLSLLLATFAKMYAHEEATREIIEIFENNRFISNRFGLRKNLHARYYNKNLTNFDSIK